MIAKAPNRTAVTGITMVSPQKIRSSTMRMTPTNRRKIARLSKLLEERKIKITLEPSAREWLADKGWDPAYGARPLKRVIQKSVQDPLAELVLSGRIKDGDKVAISAGKQGLKFNGAAVAAAA